MRDYNIHPLSDAERAEILARHPEPPSIRKRPKAEVVTFPVGNEPPRQFTQEELIRRQQIIDAVWEKNLADKRELEEMYRGSCHRGPGDSDWGLR
jgi:hypothetical protein